MFTTTVHLRFRASARARCAGKQQQDRAATLNKLVASLDQFLLEVP